MQEGGKVMKENKRNLVLKDLCGRLPDGVKCENHNHVYGKNIFKVTDIRTNGYICGEINNQHEFAVFDPLELKPYLFPLSNMSEEQMYKVKGMLNDIVLNKGNISKAFADLIQFFDAEMLDYRGLLDDGLACDATGLGVYEK